jgi:predicted  nucleic acid-binding Zn-ribbon protein
MLDDRTITQCSRALEMTKNNDDVKTVQALDKRVRSLVARTTEIDTEMSRISQQVSELVTKASDLATELEVGEAEVMAHILLLRKSKTGYKDQSSVFSLGIFEEEVKSS